MMFIERRGWLLCVKREGGRGEDVDISWQTDCKV